MHPSRKVWVSSSPQISSSLNVSLSFQMASIAFCTKCSKDTSDEGTRHKFFPTSTAHFGSLAFTLLKSDGMPCCAAHFRKACQPVWHGTARQDTCLHWQKKRCHVMSCRALLAHLFVLLQYFFHQHYLHGLYLRTYLILVSIPFVHNEIVCFVIGKHTQFHCVQKQW